MLSEQYRELQSYWLVLPGLKGKTGWQCTTDRRSLPVPRNRTELDNEKAVTVEELFLKATANGCMKMNFTKLKIFINIYSSLFIIIPNQR